MKIGDTVRLKARHTDSRPAIILSIDPDYCTNRYCVLSASRNGYVTWLLEDLELVPNTDLSVKLPRESTIEYYKRVRAVLEDRIKELKRQIMYRVTRSAARGTCEKCNTPTNWIVMTGDRGAYWCGCD